MVQLPMLYLVVISVASVFLNYGMCESSPDSGQKCPSNTTFWGEKMGKCIPKSCLYRMWKTRDDFFDPETETDSSSNTCWVRLENEIPKKVFDEYVLDCPPNSSISFYAVEHSDEMLAKCVCDPNLEPTSDMKRCISLKSLNESCTLDTQCSQRSRLTCSAETQTCTCEPPSKWNSEDSVCYSQDECERRNWASFYDPASGKCLITIHNRCKKDRHSDYSDQIFPCPKNAHCPGDESYCRCNDGFTEAEDRQSCLTVKSYGEDCGENEACNPAEHTSCQNGTCTCPDHTIWDEDDRKCGSLVGWPCKDSV